MIDYSITVTDNDGDTVTLSHDSLSPGYLMLETYGMSGDQMRTIMVNLNMVHIRALARFLDMVHMDFTTENEEEKANV